MMKSRRTDGWIGKAVNISRHTAICASAFIVHAVFGCNMPVRRHPDIGSFEFISEDNERGEEICIPASV